MFAYSTPKFYLTQSESLSPRDKYFAALVKAKEAEEEYLSAEAVVEYEEFALRRRLKELELQKRRFHGIECYPSYRSSDRFSRLRLQLEEEEHFKALEDQVLARAALALKREQENKVRLEAQEEAVARAMLVLKREREQRKFIALEEKRKALESQRARHGAQQARNVAFIRQSRPNYSLFDPDTVFLEEPKKSLSFGDYTNVAAALAAKEESSRHCSRVGKVQVNRDDARKPPSSVAGGSSRANNIDKASAPNAIVELLKAILGDAVEVKTSPVESSSSAPSTSNSIEIVPQSKTSDVRSQQSSYTSVEECLNAALDHVAQKVEATASRAAPTICVSQPAEKKISTIESSLKAELEARLNNDQSNEIKDTIRAIFASLKDEHWNASSLSNIKGKEKTHPISTEDATSKDVVSSMEAVRNVEAAFRTLESEFVFPAQLDFTPALSPASSDSELSPTGRLAYTSRNAPVRYYEQSLSGLLAQLDSVESFGDEALRSVRKEVVGRVESALEELEREVDGRWRSKTAKEGKVAEEQSVVNAQAAEQKVIPEFASQVTAPKDNGPVLVDTPTPAEVVAVHEDDTVATDVILSETAVVPSQPEPTELLVSGVVSVSTDKGSLIKDEELEQASVYPPPSVYPPSSTSIDTIRPYDVESQSSEDPRETFLFSEENSADKETSMKKKVDDDTGSDWSEVEA
ncbi:uncharacterized protein BT62DRAFT_927449 [Guyanagaster necrorhizus]|uniref:BAG domain-containing protein n=1 Tax=Guyanagaster necrorhizus TaxID=856835 RepID=A0A9P7W152_9AGAR|nr:uncharacterized protein BT62DRAFT_927449 [Guyanagaster necrorhizus MCA 3950]KAG7450135.1 hypothetical protein BT62DRAFT_927449 [Guyanagaster necrorhizus MCA 3950]